MYRDFSKQLNQLINTYFTISKEEDMEVQIAGSEEERNLLIPLCYVETHREKAELESEAKQILREYHHGMTANAWRDPANRMKPLDVTKVLMGIQSSREAVRRFRNDGTVWGRRREYAYEDVLKLTTLTVQEFYCEQLANMGLAPKAASKKRLLN